MALLELDDVRKSFPTRHGTAVHAVNGVSVTVEPGETLGIIGESGSGKSTVARLALGLLTPDSGRVIFDGHDLAELAPASLRRLRSSLTAVFQEPFESLNPRMRVGRIIGEPLEIHAPELTAQRRRERVLETMERVSLDPRLYDRYPRDLSGGQQQRVGIARGIVTRPRLVVLDEPTSSLDVSVRAQVLLTLRSLQLDLNLAYVFISHDLSTVEYVSDRLAIMYLGQVVETGPTATVLADPQHPYTRGLLSARVSVPAPGARPGSPRYRLRNEIPTPTQLPTGCYLAGRCPIQIDECTSRPVPLDTYVKDGHRAACLRAPSEFWHDYPRAELPRNEESV